MSNHDLRWKTIRSTLGLDQTIDPGTCPAPVKENNPFPPSHGPDPSRSEYETPNGESLSDEDDDDQLNSSASDQMIERARFQAESLADQNNAFEKFRFQTLWR